MQASSVKPRTQFWNDWTSPEDFEAILREANVAEEWRARVGTGQPQNQLHAEQRQPPPEFQYHQQLGQPGIQLQPQVHRPLPAAPGSSYGQFLGRFGVASGNLASESGQNYQSHNSSVYQGHSWGGQQALQQQHQWNSLSRDAGGSWRVPFSTSPFSGVPVLTKTEFVATASILIERHFSRKLLRHFPDLLLIVTAVAMVESSLQPFAYRFEARIQEASTGLMQVLQSTADWLARDIGYRAYEIDWTTSMLYRPFVGAYYGLAYLEWLSDYGGKRRGEEFVVRGYNGGPGGAASEKTAQYWIKYQAAKQSLAGFAPSTHAVAPTASRPSPGSPLPSCNQHSQKDATQNHSRPIQPQNAPPPAPAQEREESKFAGKTHPAYGTPYSDANQRRGSNPTGQGLKGVGKNLYDLSELGKHP